MYIYIYICTCICIYISLYIYIYIHIHIHTSHVRRHSPPRSAFEELKASESGSSFFVFHVFVVYVYVSFGGNANRRHERFQSTTRKFRIRVRVLLSRLTRYNNIIIILMLIIIMIIITINMIITIAYIIIEAGSPGLPFQIDAIDTADGKLTESCWKADAFGESRGVLARKADAFGYPFQLTHFSLPIIGHNAKACARWPRFARRNPTVQHPFHAQRRLINKR